MRFPRVLSREVAVFLKECPYDKIVCRLENNPLMIIKFLSQVALNQAWFKSQFPLVLKLVSVLSGLLVNQLVSWEAVIKVIRVMIGNNREIHREIIEKGLQANDEASIYRSLIYLTYCPPERVKWTGKFKDDLSKMAIHVHFSSAHLLIKTFCTQDFSSFYSLSFIKLLNVLLQCQLWKYEKGIESLLPVVFYRMNTFSHALNALTFAELNQIKPLSEYALSFIQKYEFYVEEENEVQAYSAYSVCIEDGDHSRIPFQDLQQTTDSYLEYAGKKFIKTAHLEAIQLDVADDKVYAGRKSLQLKRAKNYTKGLFPFKEIIKLQIDHESHLTEEEILGLLIAFYIEGIGFYECASISWSFLEKISQFRPRLDSLNFINCSKIDDQTFKLLPVLFTNLGELTITLQILSAEVVDVLLKMERLDTLELPYCTLSLPPHCPSLSGLECLDLSGVTVKEGSLLSLLFSANNLTTLHAVNTPSFDFEGYFHASNLVNLAVDASQLKAEDNKIKGMDRYTKLLNLDISGQIPHDLKPLLVDLMSKKKINVTFLG